MEPVLGSDPNPDFDPNPEPSPGPCANPDFDPSPGPSGISPSSSPSPTELELGVGVVVVTREGRIPVCSSRDRQLIQSPVPSSSHQCQQHHTDGSSNEHKKIRAFKNIRT